ncbi:hypothetical protein ACROYT_G041169 [Oculina patagonica]
MERVTRGNTSSDTSGVTSERCGVTAATGAGERVCLSVLPVKVPAKGGSTKVESQHVEKPKREDLKHWPPLHDVELQQLENGTVMLVAGLKDNPSLFLLLECRAGREEEPVAVRYSLGWTVIIIGPVGGESFNFLTVGDSSVVCTSRLESEDAVLCDGSTVLCFLKC